MRNEIIKCGRLIKAIKRNKSGATAIEYGLIAALISVSLIGAMSIWGETQSNSFETLSNTFKNAE